MLSTRELVSERGGKVTSRCHTHTHLRLSRSAGRPELQAFLNRNKFVHEIEEALFPLALVVAHAEAMGSSTSTRKVVVVDLCAAKGFFAMTLSYLARKRPVLQQRIHKIVMVEKQTTVDWRHIDHANEESQASSLSGSPSPSNIPIELHSGCNIFDGTMEGPCNL
jgi:hypothetical protein